MKFEYSSHNETQVLFEWQIAKPEAYTLDESGVPGGTS